MSALTIVIPALQAHAQLETLISAIPEHLLESTIVVDDGSQPAQQQSRVRVIRHEHNRGYGAAQKTGYAAALESGAERIVLLHGDGQYPVGPTLSLADRLNEYDAMLGSRFLEDGGAAIPRWRRWGNRFLSEVANRRLGCNLSELHTGARAFRADALRDLPLHTFSDNYLFDQQVLVGLLRQGRSIGESTVIARYDESVMSISPVQAILYGVGCLRVIASGP